MIIIKSLSSHTIVNKIIQMISSKVFGSTLIIAGTTIGAGMLALPIVSAGIGFSVSSLIITALWALMTFTALLMVEIHQYADKSATLYTLSKTYLGAKGKWLASFAMLLLFYALCSAYIAGGGGQFTERVFQLSGVNIPTSLGIIIFTLLIAMVVTIGTSSVDKVNRVLFSIKVIAMFIALASLAPNITTSYLVNLPLEQGLIFASIPVIFTSFGFHGSIPSVVQYLDGDTKSLRRVMIVGASIPLIIYIFWQVVTLGVIEQSTLLQKSNISGLVAELSHQVNNKHIGTIIGIFADMALLTSFLGVSLGLFQYLGDSLYKTKASKQNPLIALITFLPPMGFALFYPQGFILALGYAAIALVILAIFLPVLLAIKVRKIKTQHYQVAGGYPALVICVVAGLIIIIAQLMISFGWLPSLA